MSEPGDPPRRGFLHLATQAAVGLLGALVALPGFAFLAAPLRRAGRLPGEPDLLRVAASDHVEAGRPHRASVVGIERDAWTRRSGVVLGACWLVRSERGDLRALSVVCPHLACSIDWDPEARRFECPCHSSAFGEDGRVLGGPSPRPMDELEVEERNGQVYVRYRRFRPGVAGKEPLSLAPGGPGFRERSTV